VPVFAACEYVEPLSTAIQRLKYRDRPDLAAVLARLFTSAIAADARSLLVPVPLHTRRLAERGYNQAALLGRELASRTGLLLAPLALRRTRETEQQAQLTRAERLTNVENAFEARSPRELQGRPVILVDDVVTTGATALGCLRALAGAGAKPQGIAALAIGGVRR
jgi:ComF family protein